MPDLTRLRRHAATHEAGHAVVHTLLHREQPERFPLLAAAWVDFERRRGAVDFQVPPRSRWVTPATTAERQATAVGLAMVSAAGAIGESVILGSCHGGYTKTDLPALHRHLDRGGITAAQRGPLIAQITARTRELLQRPAVRHAVEAVAAELLARGRLTGLDVLRIVEASEKRYARGTLPSVRRRQ